MEKAVKNAKAAKHFYDNKRLNTGHRPIYRHNTISGSLVGDKGEIAAYGYLKKKGIVAKSYLGAVSPDCDIAVINSNGDRILLEVKTVRMRDWFSKKPVLVWTG